MFKWLLGPKLVRFQDGRYGVKKNHGFFWVFVGREGTWWGLDEHINKYCKFESEQDALAAYQTASIDEKTVRTL